MDEYRNDQQLEPTKYEQLYYVLHAYRFGAISCLELLRQSEEVWASPHLKIKLTTNWTRLREYCY